MGFGEELVKIYDLEVKYNEPMKKHTAIGLGGAAQYYTEVKSLCSLNSALKLARRYRVPVKVIGQGSNLLVSDCGYKGLIISTKGLKDLFLMRDGVKAMCGVKLKTLADFAARNKLTGFEPFSGIPGTVGGAVVQNAGAFGHEISERITTVETLYRGKICKRDVKDCGFGYRKSRYKRGGETVISVQFALERGEYNNIKQAVKEYTAMRRSSQPYGKNCGSVFLNGEGYCAGSLIDGAGLKGHSVGGASVSEKHANFIVTSSSATAKDVYLLINYIKKKVYEKFGISLCEEVEYIGEF